MTGLRVGAVVRDRDVDVEFSVDEGTVTAILGPNGAGKSTILSVIAGLHRPDAGRVELNGRVLTDVESGVAVAPHKRGVALLAQQALLFPHMTAAANVAFAPRSSGASRRVASAAADRWLAAVDASALANRKPAQLSGGQAQRVAVARALAAEPALLLLDEPMAALDVSAAPALRTLLRRVLRTESRTAVLVTHDALDALALADRAVVLDGGRVVEQGEVRQLLARPRSAFAARIAGINLLSGTVVDGGVLTGGGVAVAGTVSEALTAGSRAVAIFGPGAVSVYAELPHGSPRNHFRVTIAEIENRGDLVRLRGEDEAGDPGLMADVTPAAAADLDLVPGSRVFFVVKARETALYPAE
ncbi:sulfate/molybdate ABC transporter ATP-binding protein [Antrihabitans cavernicola]|uniref:ATP-binding cassette domain-containing protein n=1 Tax=Antrihabitans cavernicola TaxID=2495913 RepID=A0A5A7S7Q2_9NOCA|nr:ATP-binding cassette domain-containing protein [Spelaeibacter cavernicola]KAA0022188.1 ATP-binding cassette domain-containing protein [Spelaeibacter cavernicola]